MKRKHFIVALMAMLSCLAFTARAQVAKVGNTEYATIDEAISKWTNGTTLTLLRNVTLSDVVELKSTEHHILNLGKCTMTAASGKNAIVIKACGTGDSERTAITIKADATNPGGINAGSKCVVYYKYADGGISGNDRPIIKIEGGVFTGSTSSRGTAGIYTIGTAARKCATLNIAGGTFNCTINGATKSKLIISGGVFNYSVGSTGDNTAIRKITGGKFKSFGWMTNDNKNGKYDKFTIGTDMVKYDVGVYVDKDGYLCIGGPVITELSAQYPAKASNYSKWSSHLMQSSAAEYGLFYEDVDMAIAKHGAANVTVYEHAEVVEELDNNAAVKDFTPVLPAEVKTFEVEVIDIEATTEATTKVTFNVEPKNASGQKVSDPTDEITFRLPVPAAWSGKANVYHEGTLLGAYTIKEESGAKYVEVKSDSFSEFAVEAIVPLFAGEGTETSPYIIDSSDKLVALRNSVNGGEAYAGMYFKLTSNITLSGEWTAIGNGSRSSKSYTGNAFKGVFDGDNNTISGLTITSTTAADAAIGLFGVVDGGTVKNLNLEVNINVANSNLAGGAIGMMLNGATAENITVNGAIVGNDGVGGIAGRLVIDGTIANCTNNASVTSSYGGIGGVVGKAYYEDGANTATFASITNCTNKGTIKAPMYVGGIAGLARANVSGCVNEGAIVGGTQTGGIVGQLMAAGTVSDNENKAKVTGTSHVGGIIGDYTQSGSYTYNKVSIATNTNRGEISATGDCAAILGCNNVDGFTAMTATSNVSYYFVEGLALFGNPEDMTIDATNKFLIPVAKLGGVEYFTISEAVAAAQDGDEIVIIANVELTETTEFPAGKTITLNLNNKKVSAADKNVIKNNGAALTIKNGTIERTGTVAGYAVNVVSGTLEVENVTIVGGLYTSGTSLVATNTNISQASASRHAIYAYNCAVTINSGTYHNYNAGNATIFAYGSSVITIEDGTFSIDNGKQTLGWTSCMLDANAGGKFVINGGTFKGHFRVQANSAMEINGGTFENTNNEAYAIYGTAVVKGGTFTDAAAQTFAKNNIADDCTLGEDGKVVSVVAKIGETKYETLDAAFAAATEGQTITMLDDATPALTSQRAITKAAVIDLGGKTMTLTEDDLYFGTTTFKNGTIVVDPSVKPSTAVFWMFANQTLTFDNVKIVATGVTGTYLIGLEGENSDLNLLNGSEILVENTTALDLDIICVNGTNTCDIKVENSKVNVTNLDGRVFFRGNYTVKDSEVNLAGITKAGFRIEAGQTLSIEGTSEVNISGEPRDGGIHMTDLSATYTKAETATVNATVNEPKVAKVGENTYRTLAQAVAAVEDGGTITLIANETFTKNNRYNNGGYWDGLGYSGDKSFTIDLAGFTISQDGSLNDYLLWFKNAGSKKNTITIKNGTLDAGTTAFCALCTASSHENELTINTENLTLINNNSNGSTVKVRAGSVLNVKEGTKITGKNSYLGIENWKATVNIYDGAEIYMNGTASYNGCLVGASGGGTVNVSGGYGKGVKGGFIAMTSGGTINVAGGEWIANTDGTVGNNSNLYVLTAQSNKYESGFAGASIINVTGGTFRGGMDAWVLNNHKDEKAELNIKGGNFNANPTKYVEDDYIAVENNVVWNVVRAAAKIGDTKYTTLESAFKAATADCTIEILSDVTVDYAWDARKTGAKFTVPVTINGNGKTIKFTNSVNDNNYQAAFRFEADATVKNLIVDMSEVTDSRFRAISSKGNLTVDDCKFIGKDESLNCRAIIFGEGAGANVGNLAIAITNSEFINWKRGITDNENAQDVKTVTITGNKLTDAGVGVSAKETVTFTGNTVAGAYVNIKSYTAGNSLNVVATDNTLEENTETAYNVINAGGTINAQEGFNASLVAKIGEATYGSLQVAVNAVKNGETITLTSDVTENVTLTEKVGLYYTIDGAGKTMKGSINVASLSDTEDNRRITIKNIKFVDTADANVDFISSVNTNHYPRLTIEGCTFTGSGNDGDAAVRLKSSHSVVIKDCTATGLHSFIQNTSGWNLTIENVTVTDSKSGFALGTVQGVTVKGVNIDVAGYGIRLDADTYNNNAVIENNTISAFIPVVVRKANAESNITVKGTNTFKASNTDGLWMAIGTSEYEENGKKPDAATGKVKVVLTDTGLDAAGIYGSYYDALTIHVGATQTGRMVTRDVYVDTMDEAVAEAKAISAGAVTYKVYGEVELTTGGSHGILDLGKNVVIVGADATAKLTIVGGGVPDIKGVTFKNIILADEGTYLPTANEFMYQNYIDCTFENVTFVDGIRLSGTSSIKDSKVDANTTNEYAIWLDEGEFTMTGTTVVGGADAYGLVKSDAVSKITITGNTFQYLGEANKEALNVKEAVIIAEDNKFIDCVKGILPADKTNYTDESKTTAATDATIAPNNTVTVNYAAIGEQKYETLLEAINAVQEGETITLLRDVTMDYNARDAYATQAQNVVINGNGKVLTLNQKNSDWSSFGLANNSKLVLTNMTIVKTGYGDTNGAWNTHAIIFSSPVEMNGVTVNNSVAVQAGAALTNVTINEANGYYGLWINGNGQTVTVKGGAINATNGGRGIKIADQYIDAPAQVTLSVDGTVFYTAKKAAVLVSSEAGANITAANVNIANVAEDSENFVWVDEDWAQHFGNVEVTGATVRAESAATFTAAITANGAVQAYYKTLAEAINAAQAGATVELLADVTLAGGYTDATEGLRIEKEITLNGNGHTIDCGNFQKGIRIYNLGTDGDFKVNFNNVEVVNNVANGRCIDTRSHDINLTITDSKLIAQNGNSQPLTIGGSEAIQRVKLDDAIIDAGNSGYGVIAFVPVKQNIYAYGDTKVTGYAAFYLKDHGNANIKLSLGKGTYIGKNIHSGASNAFGTVVLEGDNNVVQIIGTNPTLKAITEGNASQAVVLVLGANNKVSLESESATIDIVGENAYYGMINAENTGTTTIINKGNTMFPVAEVGGFQFVTIKEAIRYAGNEGTIKIVNDIVLAEAWTIPAGKKYTLDLNGKTVSYTSAVAGEDMITNRGNLTITDSSDAKTGKLAYVNTDNTASNVTVSTISTEPGSTLVVDGGTIENKTVKADGSSIYSYAIDILTNGNLGDVNVTINGGTVYSDYMAIRQFNNGTACKNSLTINGGNIYGAKRAVQVHMDNNAAVTAIKGGKVEAGEGGYALCNFAATSDLAVTGGEFIGAVYSARENFISGGIYDAEVYAGYCAEGYMPNKNADGTYGVVVAKDVYASIDGVTYASLADAITAAKAGETITFLQNITEDVTIGKSITIDGANKKYTGNIQVTGGNAVATIKNVNFVDGSGYAVKTNTIKNITIENCTVTGYNYGFLYANKSTATITVKDVTIDGGSYGLNWNYGTTATLEDVVMTNVKYGIYTRNHGTKTFTIKNCDINATTPIYIDEKGTAKQTFAFEGVNNLGKTPAELSLSQYAVINGANVGTYYGTLQSMVEKAENGQTVKMLSDIAMTEADCVAGADRKVLVDVAGKNITLDMNGKTISVTHMDEFTNDYIVAVIRVADGAGLTVTGNGTIDVKVNEGNPDIAYMFWKRGTTGYLTIENGTFKMNDSADSMVYTNGNESVFVKGGTWTLDSYGTRGNREPWIFNVKGSGDNHVVVTGGTYNADINRQHWSNEVLVPETYYTVANADGTYTVNEGAVAYVNEGMLTGPFFVKKNIGYATLAEAIAEVDDDETVTMLKDVTLDETLVVAADKDSITLDLAGKTINAGWDDETAQKHIYAIDNKGNLVIKGNGTINARGIYNYGELTLNGATINAIDANGGYAVKNFSGAKFTMEAGTIATTNEDGDVPGNGYDATTVQVDEGAEFIMNGGEINNISNYTSAIINYGTTTVKNGKVSSIHSTLANHGTMTIDGGEFTCNGLEGITAQVIWATDGSTTTINGGTFDGKDNYNGFNVNAGAGAEVIITGGNFLKSHSGSLYGDGNIAVSGGFFYEAVPDKYCAADYRSVEVADGRYTVERFCFHFVDGEFTEYVNDKDVENATITYKRANIPTTWTAFYVPFEVPVKVLADQGFEVAYINGVRRKDKDENGVLDDDGFAMEVIYIHGGDNCDGSNKTLKANYPYFIRTKGSTRKNLEIKLEGRTLYAAKDATYDCTTMTEKFEITGISSQKTLVNVYGVAGGEWSLSTVPQTMKPFRFYMLITSRENSEPVIITSPMRIVVRGEELENGETLIYDIEESKGHSADRIFDLQGRRVLSPIKGNLYIINGKKVVY